MQSVRTDYRMMDSTVDNYATEGQCIREWYCARTITGREQALADALSGLQIETFLPQYTHTRRRSVTRFIPATRRYVPVPEDVESRRALFPGYLFARLADSHWAAVKTRLGVHLRPRWVDFGAGPVTVDPELIDAIANWQQTSPVKPVRAYRTGQAVEILTGPFAGFTGLFSGDADERVNVLVSMLGRQPLISFAHNEIQPLTYSFEQS